MHLFSPNACYDSFTFVSRIPSVAQLLLSLVWLLSFSGCGIRPRPVLPHVTKMDTPNRGDDAKAELGDTILVKGTILSFPGLRLLEDFTIPNWRGTAELKAGVLKAVLEDSDWTY